MKDRILILGKGFIGNRLRDELGFNIADEKIYSLTDAQNLLDKYGPKIIINCIGYIGRTVDDCEKDVDKALAANTFVPIILGEVALRNNIKLIHISSGCIYHYDYDKDTPIKEDKAPDFLELYYSRTKIYAEEALKILFKKYPILIIRLRVPLDNRPTPKNLLTKLIEYRKVINLPNSVTYIPDFVQILNPLIDINATGIYNAVNKKPLLYSGLLEVYKKYAPDFSYEIVDFRKLNLVRTNLILSTEKLEQSGFKVRDIHEVLEECVKAYVKY